MAAAIFNTQGILAPPNALWTKTYGGTGGEEARSLVATSDGGYALAGYTESYSAGGSDAWLVKTAANGTAQWSKAYGETGNDLAFSVVETVDGGYAIAGQTYSYASDYDFWLVKTDANGNAQWDKTYEGAGYDVAYSLVATSDGGYALAGTTLNYVGVGDFWLVKTDANGNEQWNKTYGGTYTDEAYSLVETSDGGYALTGYTTSFGAGSEDFWLVKTDMAGNMEWNKTYGGTGYDESHSLIQTADGGYAIAGSTQSYGGGDFWFVKADANGNEQWNKTYGGTMAEAAFSIIQTIDGGYALTGVTFSYGAGSKDAWLVRTDANGNAQWNKTYGGTDFDGAYSLVETSDGGYALAGYTAYYTDYNAWLVKTAVDTTGSILINNNDIATSSASVTLSLTYSDTGPGVSQVRYSNDGIWDTESWETPSATKAWTLTLGEGTKTVYYQVKNNVGGLSPIYNDTIMLDTTAPTGSIQINGGASSTTTASVTLSLTYYDATSGVYQVRYSNDGVWDTEAWESTASSKAWTLSGGNGEKTVYYQVRDYAGNIMETSDSVILNASTTLYHDVAINGTIYVVETCSNSSVSDLSFSQVLKSLRFTVNGTSGTGGFCNVTVPAELMSGDFSIYLDAAALVEGVDYTESFNGTHYLFNVNYAHSIHEIKLVSTEVIPDFAGWLFIPFLMLVTLSALILKKKLEK